MQIVELYQFVLDGVAYNFTSSKRAYSYSNLTFEPIAIGRSSLIFSDYVCTASLDVSLDLLSTFGQICKDSRSNMYFKLLRAVDGSVAPWFEGFIAGKSFAKNVLTLSFNDRLTQSRRNGIRRPCTTSCPFTVYGVGCYKVKEETTATVSAINGNLAILTGTFSDDVYTSGMLRFGISYSTIYSQTANSFHLKNVPSGLAAGAVVYIAKGCDQTPETCRDRFSNIGNFGGFPKASINNPFSSSDSL